MGRASAGPRLRRLARPGAETRVDGRSHDPRQDLQARQQVRAHAVRASRSRHPGQATASRDTGLDALDRQGLADLVAIALANKLARIAWAVLARGRTYQPTSVSHAS